ncbi:hypothetical protein ACSS6W_010149 [Trichoderma asperelloides]
MKSSPFIIAPLLSLLCSADSSKDSFGTEAEGISNGDWDLAMRSANATGTASIPGYNIREKYPGKKSDNWTLSISVASDIPGGNTANGKFVTGTQIEWKGPPGVISGADSSWFLCHNVYSSLKLKQSGAGSTNGSCTGLLSNGCLSALQKALEASTQCQNNTLPSVCADELELGDGKGFGLTSAHAIKSSNTSDSIQIRYGNESHDRGNFTAYDNAIRQVWLVMTGFAEAGSDNAHPRGSAGQPGSVACIQADEIQANSRDFKNAASIASSSLVKVLMGLSVAMSLYL